MNCQTCGETLSPGLEYCQGCRRPIANSTQTSGSVAQDVSCPDCGAPMIFAIMHTNGKGFFFTYDCHCNEPVYYSTSEEASSRLRDLEGV